VQTGSATDWDTVSAGKASTCGIRDGDLYCWGKNRHLQLGLGTDVSGLGSCSEIQYGVYGCNAPELVDDTRTWTDVDMAAGHACGVDSAQQLYCWGANDTLQAGQSTGTNYAVPAAVP
jgi:alpha-tubulin suppressor-like RCC1 family protein